MAELGDWAVSEECIDFNDACAIHSLVLDYIMKRYIEGEVGRSADGTKVSLSEEDRLVIKVVGDWMMAKHKKLMAVIDAEDAEPVL